MYLKYFSSNHLESNEPVELFFPSFSEFCLINKIWTLLALYSFIQFLPLKIIQPAGLPPSPPSPLSISTIDDEPYPGHDNNGITNKPLGVDVRRMRKDGLGGRMIAVIVFSSFSALVICMAIAWLFLLKRGNCVHQPQQVPHASMTSPAKPSGTVILSSRS